MTHIEQMIQDMCPNGVEWKTLGEVCIVKTAPMKLDKKEYQEEGLYPIVDQGQKYIVGYTDNAKALVPADDYVIFGDHTREIKYVDFTFAQGADGVKILKTKNEILPRFLYHVLKNTQIPSRGYNRHWTIAKDIEIPLPPIEIQKKIVECLDKFSALAAELQAELQAELHLRRKQYEYYRTQLLTPHSDCNSADKTDDCNWDSKPLKDLIVSLKTGLNPRTNFKLNTPESNIPYITGKDIYDNVINVTSATDMIDEKARDLINKRACLEGNILLFASTGTGTVGRMAYVPEYNNDWAMSETLYAIKTKDVLLPRFLMHCLYSPVCRSQFENKISRGSVPHLKVVDLLNVNIPLPPIEEQKRLTELLDKFDKLTTSLEEGIPAEQIRQQKRYEYYRDLLLTFDRKAV